MVNKLDEFKISIQNDDPSIILVTETWLNNKIPDNMVYIPGYTLYRKDRGSDGGGVCIYIRNNIAGHTVTSYVSAKFNTVGPVESLWLEVSISKIKFLVACIYRQKQSTSVEQNQQLLQTLESAISSKNSVYILGDFNYPEINWENLTVSPNNQCSLDFLESYKTHSGEQVITFPTRIRNNQISLLDLFIVNDKKNIFDIQENPPLGRSDHIVITAKSQLQIQAKPTRKIYKRNFWTADYQQINNFLLQQNFDFKRQQTNSYVNLETIISTAIHCHIPYKPKRVNPQKPWLNREIFREIQKKRNLWHRYSENKTEENYLSYRVQNNKTKRCIEDTRKLFEHNLVNSSDKLFYSYIKRSLNSQLKSFSLMDKNTNTIIDSQEEMAKCFAQQFQSVFVRASDQGSRPALLRSTFSQLEIRDIVFTPEKIKKALDSLNNGSSPGPDEIPAVFLSKCKESLCVPLSNVMNDIIQTGCFPETWKKALVIPIFKKGNKQLAENYRPISLTSTICKCMEKIVVNELTTFFLDNHVIPPQQHGFLPHRSTVTNLLSKLQEWTQADDNKQPTDVIYLDFEKAFDKIPTDFLILKLQHYGVRGKLLHFIGSFLQGRKFQVRVESALSKEYEVFSGVPQGSVLGPLLFVVYLSDLYAGLKTNYSSFADDTNLYCNPLQQCVQLQDDLKIIKTWTKIWKMPLNDTKCTVLHIGQNNPKYSYFLDQTEIASVKQQKDLGVIITENLKWVQQITQIVKKTNALVYIIKASFRDHSSEMILKLYKSFIRPKIEYAQCIWSPYYVKDIEALERVQRRVTKIPIDLQDLPYESRLKKLKLTTLKERRLRGDLIETYKITSGYYWCNLEVFTFSQAENLRGHNKKLLKERCNKLLRRNFLTNRVVYSWNRLKEDTINSASVNQFKNRLDNNMKDWNSFFIHYF